MGTGLHRIRTTVVSVLLGAMMMAAFGSQGQATTMTLPFLLTGTTTYVFGGSNGVVDFELALGGPAIGSFSVDHSAPGPIGQLLLLGPSSTGTHFHGVFSGSSTSSVVGTLFEVSQWTVGTLDSFEFPLTLVITSNLIGLDSSFAPVLTGNFIGDFQLVSSSIVPLPAALPMFVSGIGMLGWVALRRRKTTAARGRSLAADCARSQCA
jgi:hypothetical protein